MKQPALSPTAEAAHALLSPSKSATWLACPPSARLCENLPDEAGVNAAQGSFAHALAAARVIQYVRGLEGVSDAELALRETEEFKLFMNGELNDDVNGYVRRAIIVIAQVRAEDPDALILVEQRVYYDKWTAGGSGSLDLGIISKGKAYVIDLKYGFQMHFAVDSSQLMLYALGFVQTYGTIYEFTEVTVRIDQPRRNHLDEATYTVEDLLTWADQYVKPQSELAWAGKGSFVPGDHCSKGFCKARHTCKARIQRAVFTGEDALEAVKSPLMSDADLASIGPEIDASIKALKQLKSWMAEQALANTAQWSTMKLVRGPARRRIDLEPFEVAMALEPLGVTAAQVLQPTKMVAMTTLEKLVGKKAFVQAIGADNIVKPDGRLTLVPASDKRLPWAPEHDAEDDFDDVEYAS